MIVIFTILACVGIYYTGSFFLGIISGKELDIFKMEMVIIVFGGGFFALCQLMYFILLIMRLQKRILTLYFIGSMFSTFVSLILITKNGLLGASIAFACSHLILFLAYTLTISRNLKKIENIGKEKKKCQE